MKPNSALRNLLAAGSSLLAISPASAATVLYFDDFSGDVANNLHATTPDTSIGTNTWIANSDWKADGSISVGGSKNAFLPFVPTVGLIYTLTATLDKPVGLGASPWGAIGFTNDTLGSSANATFWGGSNAAGPWMLYRANNDQISTFAGTGTANSASHTSFNGTQTLTIVLDTTDTNWKAEWFVGTASLRQFTYTTNPTISYVGIGSENAENNFSSFSLSVIPEPRAALLGGLGLLILLRRRR